MFVVEVGSVITTIVLLAGLFQGASGSTELFVGQVTIWLWFTVLFTNFAEAVAEGRGKAQAAALRRTRSELIARRPVDGREERVPAPQLRRGDLVVAEAGDLIPGDGTVVEGIASVDESAITGESAPVIREAGGDRSARHRRHPGALGPRRDRDHGQPWGDLPGPDDRSGGERLASQDAE
jgi:K+-transporting ATPase ATPase B chain